MAKADLGTKRSCSACEMRFYDFNRKPIICPGCGEAFDSENLIKKRNGKKSKPTDAATPDQNASAIDGDELDNAAVSFDDDDAGEDSGENGATGATGDNVDDDIDVDFDDSDNDVDEEDGGLIQDNLAADDELLTNIPSSDEE